MADETMDGQGAPTSPEAGTSDPQSQQSQLDAKGTDEGDQIQQGPQQTPAQTAAQFPMPGSTSTSSSSPTAQNLTSAVENIPDNSKFINPNLADAPPQVQQAVQTGGYAHQVIQALAGGPRTKTTIDPNTGTVVRTKAPLSNGQAGMAIALAALTGAFNGLAQKGPGAEGKAAAVGFNSAVQQRQQQNDQENDEAAKTYARQAALAQTNFTMHQTAQRMGMLDYDFHQKLAAANAPAISAINAVGAVQATGVHESDLLSKYNITKDAALVDGVVPRLDQNTGEQAKDQYGQPLWDNTYTVVDPSKKIGLDQTTAQYLAEHHVPGYFTMQDGKAVPKDFSGSAQIRAGLVINGMAQAGAIQTTEAQLGQQISRLGGSEGQIEGKVFQANLKDALDKGTVTPAALQKFAGYASMPFDQALATMRKDKVDPQLVGQIASLVPQSVQDDLKTAQLTREAINKEKIQQEVLTVDKNNYTKVLSDPTSYSPAQVNSAKAIRQMELSDANSKSFGEAYNRTQGEINAKLKNGIPITPEAGQGTDNLTHPELAKYLTDDNYKTPTGRNDAFLNAMMQTDPERAKLVQAYANGKDIQSYYASAKKFGGSIAADIHAYDPSFNTSDIHQYEKTVLAMGPSGPIGKANKAASTTFVHLNNLNNSIGVGSTLGINGAAIEHQANAISEMSNAYANGNKPGENEIQDQRKSLGSQNPLIIKPAISAAAGDLIEKVRADHDALAASLPRGIQVPGYIDNHGADALYNITHKPVDVDLIVAPSGATQVVPEKNTGVKWYVDAHGHAISKVPGQGN